MGICGDQIFARAVIDLGRRLEVVIPAIEYRAGLPDAQNLDGTKSRRLDRPEDIAP